MAAESRKQLPLLVGLLAVLLIVLWWQFGGSTPAPVATTPAARPAAPPAAPGRAPAAASTAELFARGVALARLSEDRPAPEEGGRDPFRTGVSSPSAGPAGGGSTAPPGPVVPPPVTPNVPLQPAGPPPLPPIAVKFIGVVSRRDIGKVAVLSDGKNVYYGREGEIVDGRWRIVAIGEESLQIEYADGRGRQTVRLTG
jgi:hypothetical protein